MFTPRSPVFSSCGHYVGVKWRKAQSQGRLLNITNLICLDCGNLNEDDSVTHGIWAGCLLGGLLAVSSYFVFAHLLGTDRWIPVIISLALLFLPQALTPLLVSLKHRDGTQELRFKGCKNCGSMRYVKVGNAKGMDLICPTCGGARMTISTAGIS